MLPKKNRLTKKNDFDRVFKKGISVFDYILGIKILKNNLPDSRFGIIVSNKISKKANERNKIKRQIRECLKKINPNFSLKWVKKSHLFRANYAQPVFPTNYSEQLKDINKTKNKIWFANMSMVYPYDRGTNYAIEIGKEVAISALRNN